VSPNTAHGSEPILSDEMHVAGLVPCKGLAI
jgi:hypothetical protein